MQNRHNEYELKYHKNYRIGRNLLVYGSFLILEEDFGIINLMIWIFNVGLLYRGMMEVWTWAN